MAQDDPTRELRSSVTTPAPAPRPPIIAREGWMIIASIALGGLILTAAAAWIHQAAGLALGLASLVVTAWSLWFFRDPQRATPAGEGLIVCPADGVISFVGPGWPPPELAFDKIHDSHGAMTRVSVFMNIFNVHVNRSPVRATVKKIAYRPGAFFNASLDKASDQNERCALALELPDKTLMAVVQIAGLIARRIVCRATEGQPLEAGERFGIIRFGSRVDVYLPAGVEPRVRLGQRVWAGVTVYGSFATPTAPDAAPPDPARGQMQEA